MHILDEAEIEKTVAERDPVLPDPQNAPSPTRPLIGQTRIGGSGLVVDTVGVGGMASVYKVWNERLELFRAVKMLSRDALHARFETEAKITAKLRHPQIVEVYSVGEWNGVPYMEMEYVDGVNMQEALEARGRFPDAVCCAAGLFIAGALDYAHTLKFTLSGNSYDGIIHRDLKPANILISKRSEIKLTDFGIARPAQTSLHTIDGNIVGTLHYLSPEQLAGGKIDPRSDIYSLGAILYEMATGAKTFPQKSITELTMHRAANSFKSPCEYDTPVTPAISNIILKCLNASPQERYLNAAELIRDLRNAYAEIAPKTAPQKTLREFFSGNAADTGITHAALMYANNVDTDDAADNDVNTDTGLPYGEVNKLLRYARNDGHCEERSDEAIQDSDLKDQHISTIKPEVPTNVNTVPSTDINTDVKTDAKIDVNTAKKPSAKFPTVKWPLTRRATVYASIALLAVLSVLHLTFKLTPHQSPKTNNKRSAAAANFFSDPVNTDTANAADTAVSPSVSTDAPKAAVNNTKPANIANAVNAVDTADVNADDVDTAAVNTNSVNIDSANTNIKAAQHTPPAPTESALIKSAAEAVDKKEWDRAIRILERSGAAFTEKRGERHLLLFESYVESRQLDKARLIADSAAKTNDALYFLTAGRYCFYRGDQSSALTALEASLTRPSALRSRNAILGDALYYIALIRSDRFKTSPTETTRKQAQEAWRRVKSAYESKQDSPRFKRAEAEILELY